MSWISQDDLHRYFDPPDPPATEVEAFRCSELSELGRRFAYELLQLTPRCADQSAAVRKIREAVWTAQAAVMQHRHRGEHGPTDSDPQPPPDADGRPPPV